MDMIVPMLSEADQLKMDFVKAFLERRFQIDDIENSLISIERLGTKSLMYLLFAMIVEYDNKRI